MIIALTAGYLTGSEDFYTHYRCYGKMCGYDLRDNSNPTPKYNGSYSTHLFASRAIDTINNHDATKVRDYGVLYCMLHQGIWRQGIVNHDTKKVLNYGVLYCMLHQG